MKKKLLIAFSILLIMLVSVVLFYKNKTTNFGTEKQLTAREKYSLFLKEHPFNNHPKSEEKILSEEEKEKEGKNKADRPDLAWEQDFLRTLDPALGRPAPERLPAIIAQIRNASLGKSAPGNINSPWEERGPNNVGGRTRAIVYDPNDLTQKKVWAGGVTGGLWYNNDVSNVDSSWKSVNNFWDNISITSIAFDPNNSLIAYVGTGEGFGSSASRGAGIWKTTNGGSTWSQISSTTGFYYVNDLVVRNESSTSVIYAAVDGGYYGGSWHGAASAGLQRSVNGGTTWTQVLPLVTSQTYNYVAADIEISANNRIWVGSKSSPYGAGGGRILTSTNGTTWTVSNTTTVTNGDGRVELACAPSDSNYVYAVIEDNSEVSTMKKTTNVGASWTTINLPVDADVDIPSTDFSRGQAWYDLIMAVDPNNSSIVLVGGVDLFRSTNGGTSWSQISKWSNNNNLSSLSCSEVHADQHAIVYKPGSSSTVLFGNDGGIFYTNSISTSATNNVISVRNKNYNVTQFYACAIHPTSNSNVFLAGAQDNGSQRFTTAGINATTEVNGGDGAYCFIDQTNPTYQITSYVYNTYDLSTNGGVSFGSNLSSDQNTGRFINPSDYDDNLHILYSCRGSGTLNRIKTITTTPSSVQTVTLTGVSDYASHICVSPYTTASSTLFVGTEAGSLYKVTTADGTPTTTNITGSSFPTGSISCVEIGANENELLVTFFNYGVTSVWYTSNGGSSWVSKEGNLPDMPIRWALFNPLNRNEVILATELGVWATVNFSNTTPTWASSNSGLANVRVDMLQIRSSDKMVIAATHGRGLFSSNGFSLNCIVPTVQASSISFTNISANQMNVNWTNGNGSRRVVYVNTINSFTAPVNGTDATANSVYSGTGAQLVYNGNSNVATVTGLTAGTTYYFRIYEANCNGTSSFYQSATGTNNPSSQITPLPLNGTYTVGSSGIYLTLTAAINDLNLKGVSGPVTFNLVNNNYSDSETFPITINNIAGASITNKITIKPTLVNTVITGSNGVAIFKLNGSKNIIIDGAISGSTRNLSIINTNSTTANSATILVSSLGTSLGASNDTIRNLTVICGANTNNNVGVWVDGADNQNIVLNNLKVEKATYGFYINGVSGNPANNIRITNSSIGSSTVTNYISLTGIRIFNAINSIVYQDSIYNILTLNINAPALFLGTGCSNITVSNNVIDNNRYIGTSGYGSRGIIVNTGSLTSNISIINNFVSRIGGDGWSGYTTDNIIGIGILNNTGGVNLYNNTVWLSESFAGYATTTNSFAMYVGTGTSGLNFRNNIFYNSIVNTNGSGSKAYAFASLSAASAFTNLNYNDYYSGGTQPMLAYFGSADKSTLATLKTATTQDLNSINLQVFFSSTSNLHLTGSSIANANLRCLPIAGVITDIDNQTRNTVFYYMGADENTTYPLPVKLNSFNGFVKNNDVELNWTTAFELNNDYFIVEKSVDNIHFEAIGKIKGKGNSNIVSNYNLTDYDAMNGNANNGILFYRLNQFDFDGQNAKSDVIVVKVSANGNNQLEAFPNPFENNITLMINSNLNSNATINIIDIQGKIVHRAALQLLPGFNNYTINNLAE
ncbi:MAG: fibronectin type III domain-containing protein, partial [Bacteroidia bacterium]